jgi:hypothetical protein
MHLRGKNECVRDVSLKNPARRARSVSISGTATLYVPQDRENEKVVINSYRDHSGRALEHPELRKRGILLTFTAKPKKERQSSAGPMKIAPTKSDAQRATTWNPYNPPKATVTASTPAKPRISVPIMKGDAPMAVPSKDNGAALVPVAEGDTVARPFVETLMFGIAGRDPELEIKIVDPKNQVYGLQLFNQAGELVVFDGSIAGTAITPVLLGGAVSPDAKARGERKRCAFYVRGELPKDGYLVLHLSTDDNLVEIPFSTTFDLP